MADPIREARLLLEETVKLARLLYGSRWEHMLEQLEDRYEGDPWLVLAHLRREVEKRGITPMGTG